MSQTPDQSRPPLATCHQVIWSAPFSWLRQGLVVYRQSVAVSLVYGVAVFAFGAAITGAALVQSYHALAIALMSGFLLIAPLLATGLYSIARQVGRGESPSLAQSVRRMRTVLGNDMLFSAALVIVFLVWVRAAAMLHIFFPSDALDSLAGMASFLAIGSAVGALFASFVFAIAAFSLPLVVDRDIDMVTAVISSVNAVLRNKPAMVCWASCIVGMTVLGMATGGVGLLLTMPWLGYATWHAYLDTIDTSGWPLND